MGLLRRPRITVPSNETPVGTVRVGDLVTFDLSSVDQGVRAVYAGPNAQDPKRMDLVGPRSNYSCIDVENVTAAHRRVGVDPEPDDLDPSNQRQYDRLTSNAKVLYRALRAEYGWQHYSSYGSGMNAHGRRY